MKSFEPMLAERKNPDLEKLRYPLYASPKLDGIRCVVREGQALTRSLKPIPNQHIRDLLSDSYFEGFDGEIIVGPVTDKLVYNTTNSAVMSRDGTPEFKFYVFDNFNRPDLPFHLRLEWMKNDQGYVFKRFPFLVLHEGVRPRTPEEVLIEEAAALEEGYEGLILRHPQAPYKYGRSTMKEQGMLKLKRFVDAEFEIIDTIELMHNANEAFTSELGRTKRSKAQEGMVPMGTLGALVCRMENGLTFEVGTGYTAAMRQQLWHHRATLMGKHAKVKYFEPGSKDRPRHPVFLGLREKEDMS